MATTKEQLLQYFRGLDIPTLEKLQKYSQFLIIPDEDSLVNATMSQMVSKAHNLADSLFPEWTDRSKSDFGEFLVELFALFSEKDFWYINAFANEGILKKMRSYSNAFSKASSMGYYPTVCKGATCYCEVTFAPGENTTYEKGDLEIDINGLKFTNTTPYTLEKYSADRTVTMQLKEGTHIAEDVTYNGYNIFLRKPNVDITSVVVIIDNIEYAQVKTFGQSSADSCHFMVLPEEDGSCSIYFGSDGYGVQPAIGKVVRVEYRTCNGAAGNLLKTEAKVSDSLSSRKALSVRMLGDATGGTYADTLTAIKEKTPFQFRTKRTAINEEVSQDIINSLSFVHKSKVTVLGQEVAYRVIPTSGALEPTTEEQNMISAEFHPCLIAGYEGRYIPNIYKSLLTEADASATQIIADVVVSAGYDLATTESLVRQVMADVTNPLIKAEYGGSFNKNDVDVLMRASIPGVQSVTFRIKVGSTESIMPDVTLGEVEIFKVIEQKDLTVRTNVI